MVRHSGNRNRHNSSSENEPEEHNNNNHNKTPREETPRGHNNNNKTKNPSGTPVRKKRKATRVAVEEVYGGVSLYSRTTYRDMKRLQTTTHNLIPKASFGRVVKEITQEFSHNNDSYRYQRVAVEALQIAAENYLMSTFERARKCALHAHRETCRCEDVRLSMLLLNP